MEKELGELKAEIRGMSEVLKFHVKNSDDKFKSLFEMMNDKVMPTVQDVKNQKEQIQTIWEKFSEHKRNHLSWLKMSGIGVALISGILALVDRVMEWGK